MKTVKMKCVLNSRGELVFLAVDNEDLQSLLYTFHRCTVGREVEIQLPDPPKTAAEIAEEVCSLLTKHARGGLSSEEWRNLSELAGDWNIAKQREAILALEQKETSR